MTIYKFGKKNGDSKKITDTTKKNIINNDISSSIISGDYTGSNSSVIVNGVRFRGNNVSITNGKVVIDGKQH